MASTVQISVNTNTYVPGSVARQREAAVSSCQNYLPVGTYLQSAFGGEKEYAAGLITNANELRNAGICGPFLMLGTKIYLRTDEGLQYIFTSAYNFDRDAVWSSTFIEGDYYLCMKGVAVWKIDGNTYTVTEITSSLPYVPFYVNTFGLRLIIGTDDTVSWSSVTNRLDFNGQGTGAGSQAISVLGSYGHLQAIGQAPNGFIVYTTVGILAAVATNDIDIPFTFSSSILQGYVISRPEAQTSSVSYTPYAIFKGRGLCRIQIANELSFTVTVTTVNPFMALSEDFRGKVRLFNFFSGFLCCETDNQWFFYQMETSTFGNLQKYFWAVLLPDSHYGITRDGRLYELSTTDNHVYTYVDENMVYPDNIVHCDVTHRVSTGVTQLAYNPSETIAGLQERWTVNMDLFDVADSIEQFYPDGVDLMAPLKVPSWGEEYQQQWEERGNILPCKFDNHTDVEVVTGIELQPNDDGLWHWDDMIVPFDVEQVVYNWFYSTEETVLQPSATFTGIRLNEYDAGLYSKCNRVLVYNQENAGIDKIMDCNADSGIIDCNTWNNEVWWQTENAPITVNVDDRSFTWQRDNIYTGLKNNTNHTVTVNGCNLLSEIRATLLPGGLR